MICLSVKAQPLAETAPVEEIQTQLFVHLAFPSPPSGGNATNFYDVYSEWGPR